MLENSTSKNSEEIMEISNEITNKSEKLFKMFQTKIFKLKEKNKGILKNITSEIDYLNNEKNKTYCELENNFETKLKINEVLNEEEVDLEKFNVENIELKEKVHNLKSEIETHKKYLDKLESEFITIEERVSRKEDNRRRKELVYNEKANIFRKALGFDIVPVKENMIKLIFYKGDDNNTNKEDNTEILMMDFTKENVITDSSFENINLENVIKLYKEEKDFYNFVKKMVLLRNV